MIMKKLINTNIISCGLATIFALGLSFSVNAEDMQLQEAKEEIVRLEQENESLKEELNIYEKKITEHKEKLAEFDAMDMEMKTEE